MFLFGGSRIYRNMFNDNKYVECYLLSDLEKELGLDRGKLVRLAYLLGGDYADGLQGVGPVLGRELLEEFSGEDGLQRFKEWWMKVQSGRDDEEDTKTAWRRKFVRSLSLSLFSLGAGDVDVVCVRRRRATRTSLSTRPGRTLPSCVLFLLLLFPRSHPSRRLKRTTSPPSTRRTSLSAGPVPTSTAFERASSSFLPLRLELTALSRSYLNTTLTWSSSKTDELMLPLIKRQNQRKGGQLPQQQSLSN